MEYYNQVVGLLLRGDVVRATKYISDKEVITATRKRYGGKFYRGNIDIILKIGKPNYVEREFIKDCKAAKEPFPVKKIQVKLYNPKPRNPKRR